MLSDITIAKNFLERLLPSKYPANSAMSSDITIAKNFVERLLPSKFTAHPQAATDAEMGAAEAYETAVVFSYAPVGDVAPPWAVDMQATMQQLVTNTGQQFQQLQQQLQQLQLQIQQLANSVANQQQKFEELPALLVNSQATLRTPLRNPTAMHNGVAPVLAPPNPRNLHELLHFTAEGCIASANNLGLPPLPANATVLERRRQIAVRIGIDGGLFT
ncbi:hypothetical protein B0H34DRAFT_695601 [Crassisporium funariophilum]|nr:hypothetical protein B0H34DRAFT_695601 [Crassisporium funariophilum]